MIDPSVSFYEPRILVVGDGRLATHLKHYLNLLAIPHSTWSRSLGSKFDPLEYDEIWLAIKDSAIAPFFEKEIRDFTNARTIHFSGALSHPQIECFHPLFSFPQGLLTLDEYKAIPFIAFSNSPVPAKLPNPCHYMAPETKELYHAVCVLAGNFPSYLISLARSINQKKLHLPDSFLTEYIAKSVNSSLAQTNFENLTGPIVRNDKKTMESNQRQLAPYLSPQFYDEMVQIVGNLNPHTTTEVFHAQQ